MILLAVATAKNRKPLISWEPAMVTTTLDEDETFITRDAPARPLGLTDSQMSALIDAASPLPRDLRGPFLCAVAAALRGVPIGDGSVHRIVREVQREFFRAPDLRNAVPRWGRKGGGIRPDTKAPAEG